MSSFRPHSPRTQAQLAELLDRIKRGALDGAMGRHLAAHQLDAPESGEPGLVSVIIPAWGKFEPIRLGACLKSLLMQEDVRLEIIIAEQGFDQPNLSDAAETFGVRHVFEKIDRPAIDGPERLTPGRVRNAGVAASTGRHIYFSDGDLLYLDTKFFAKLLSIASQHPDISIVWPRQKHLALEGQEHACRAFERMGRFQEGDIELLDEHTMRWVGEGSDGPDALPPRFRLARMQGIHVVARQEMLDTYTGAGAAAAGLEPAFWLSLRADGATLTTRRQLEVVAGISEEFIAWGCEDSDFQWKLAQLFHVVSVADLPLIALVHMEHTRHWFDKEVWERNMLVRDQRRQRGVLDAITADLLRGRSPLHRQLRDRWKLRLDPSA